MKRHRHAPEQAIRRLREGERLLAERTDLAEMLHDLKIVESTWNRSRVASRSLRARKPG